MQAQRITRNYAKVLVQKYSHSSYPNIYLRYLEIMHNHIITNNPVIRQRRYWYIPFSRMGVPVVFVFSALDLECHCSSGRITRALGFSLGTNRASAFGVLAVSSSSLKKGTWEDWKIEGTRLLES